MDDKRILILLKEKPSKGIYEVMKCYGRLVKYIVSHIVAIGSPSDIEECVEDVFCSLWQQVDDYDETKGNLKSYIIGIARNQSIKRYQKLLKDQERTIPIDEDMYEIEQDMEEQLTQKINYEILTEVVNELSEPDREIFIRRYFWFERIGVIAKAMGLEYKQVENKLYRGKKQLKKELIRRGVNLYEACE